MTLTDDFDGIEINLNGKNVDKISDRITRVVDTIKEIAEKQANKRQKTDTD